MWIYTQKLIKWVWAIIVSAFTIDIVEEEEPRTWEGWHEE